MERMPEADTAVDTECVVRTHQEHGQKGKVVIKEKTGKLPVSFPNGLAKATVDSLIVFCHGLGNGIPAGSDIAKHLQPPMETTLNVTLSRFFIRRSKTKAPNKPARKPPPPKAMALPSADKVPQKEKDQRNDIEQRRCP